MEWSTHQVVEATGITSRTLRHYDHIGLLSPTRLGHGGLRCYDQHSLIRLQRILLLRDTGMPLTQIAAVVDGEASDLESLIAQRDRLLAEYDRLADQIRSVEATMTALQQGETLMPADMFQGFDHSKYDAEVRERWGDQAADRSASWWDGLGAAGQEDFRRNLEQLNTDWDAVITSGATYDSEQAQVMAERHVAWLNSTSPQHPMPKAQVQGIVQMYVDDPRFAANYKRVSPAGPQLVRDAVHHWAEQHLAQ